MDSYFNEVCKCGCTDFYMHEDSKSGMHIGIYCKRCHARQRGRWVSQKISVDNHMSEVARLLKCKNIEDLRGKKVKTDDIVPIKKVGNIIYLNNQKEA